MAGSSDANALVLQLSADVSKLQKSFDKAAGIVDSGSRKMESRAKRAGEVIEGSFTKPNIGRALDKVFDNSRLRVFDSAAARIGITGNALELLGPAGLAAAAGVVAVAGALTQARSAAKFADDIQDTAARLHVTTDALQEFRYANFQAGGSMEAADGALESFSQTLGKAQDGAPKALKQFQALFGQSFTKEDARNLGDVGAALTKVTKAIGDLKLDTQKDSRITAFGLDGLKPLVLGGVDAMEELRRKAHEIGIVMDADLINRGAEANKQFEVLSKVVDVQLKSAFVDLAPVLVELLKFAGDLARQINAIVDQLRSVENKTTAGLINEREKVLRKIGEGGGFGVDSITNLDSRRRAIDAELATRGPPLVAAIPHGGNIATLPSKGGSSHSRPDHSNEETQRAIDAALERVLRATYSEASSIEAQLAADEVILDLKQKARDEQIKQEVKDGKLSAAQASLIRSKEREATEAERSQKRAEAFRKQQDVLDEHQAAMVASATDLLSSQQSIANSSEERKRLALQILEAERAQARLVLERSLNRNPDLSPEQRAAQLAGFDAATAGQRSATSAANATPIEEYQRSLIDLTDTIETDAISAVRQLDDEMGGWIANVLGLHGALGGFFSHLFSLLIQQQFGGSQVGFLSGIGKAIAGVPRFASGTPSAPGGLAIFGENGPELGYVPQGSRLWSNSESRAMLNSISGSGGGGGFDVRVIPGALFDAIITRRAKDVAEPIAQGYAHGAGTAARSTARADQQRRERFRFR